MKLSFRFSKDQLLAVKLDQSNRSSYNRKGIWGKGRTTEQQLGLQAISMFKGSAFGFRNNLFCIILMIMMIGRQGLSTWTKYPCLLRGLSSLSQVVRSCVPFSIVSMNGVCVSTDSHACTYAHKRTHAYAYTRARTHTHTHTHMHAHTRAHAHTHARAHAYTHTLPNTHAHMQTHTQTCTHTRTHHTCRCLKTNKQQYLLHKTFMSMSSHVTVLL